MLSDHILYQKSLKSQLDYSYSGTIKVIQFLENIFMFKIEIEIESTEDKMMYLI